MLELSGDSLGERQKELNVKVNEAASNNIDFLEVKNKPETSDIDILFKIDLASKYRNVEYILEILKCGDSLYISRALKSIWLYDDEYSNFINPAHLHENTFPYMSMRMKRKFLSTISMYVKNERAVSFYEYCMASKLTNIALKFLIFTTVPFKVEAINENETLEKIQNKGREYVNQFIGESFVLAEHYVRTRTESHLQILRDMHHLYSVSDVKYLDLLETFHNYDHCCNSTVQLGRRISKDIIRKHKERIRISPRLYLNIINRNIFRKHSTVEDAKFYVNVLMNDVSSFWTNNFYEIHKYILDVIPFEERLQLIKNEFIDRFPGEEFEMNSCFYELGYYNLMNTEEKEAWALRHIENDLEMHGHGRDFIWYKFVSFEKTLDAIKRYIAATKNADKRAEIINILIESAKNDEELEKLFKYYYERHVNERRHHKEQFINTVLVHHNVFNITDSCWAAFNKILYSMEIYTNSNNSDHCNDYRNIALIYYIVNEKEVPNCLKQFIAWDIYKMSSVREQNDKLNVRQQDVVYTYLFEFYLDKFRNLYNKEVTEEWLKVDEQVKREIRKYIHNLFQLITQYNKSESDIPELVIQYMNLDWDEFKFRLIKQHSIEKSQELTQVLLLSILKKRASLVLRKLPLIKTNLEDISCPKKFKLSTLLNKLKVYFAKDIAIDYLIFFKDILSLPELNKNCTKFAVYGIFKLADNSFILDFMTKHAPKKNKIDHDIIDPKLLHIQEAICNYAHYSRPPIPLSNILLYIKGDYVHYCLPMFNSYLAGLPQPLCIEFIKSILDTPLSIQKHGIRLAFQCFNKKDLQDLIVDIWDKTKHLSIKMVVYNDLQDKIKKASEDVRKELIDVLHTFASDLHKDDHQSAYEEVDKSPKNPQGIERSEADIYKMYEDISLFNQDIIRSIVNEHIKTAFVEMQLSFKCRNYTRLVRAKWSLTCKYLAYYSGEKDLSKKMSLTKLITGKIITMWDVMEEDDYVVRGFCDEFIRTLETVSYSRDLHNNYVQVNMIITQILNDIEGAFPLNDVYDLIWHLRLSIVTRKVIMNGKFEITEYDNSDKSITYCDGTSKGFAKGFSSLFNESIEKGQCYLPKLELIMTILEQFLDRIVSFIDNLEFGDHYNFQLDDDIRVLICEELLEFKTYETYLFALMIIPTAYTNRYLEKYKRVINKIKTFDNEEIQNYMTNKFSSDIEHGESLQPQTDNNS